MSFEIKVRSRARLAAKLKDAHFPDELWSAVAFKVGHRVSGLLAKALPMFEGKSEIEIIDLLCTWSNDDLKDIMVGFVEPKIGNIKNGKI